MKIYNSLSQTIEKFEPINTQQVTMYVCGITPYDTTHLGHAFTYIFFDTLLRYLTHQNYSVNYTQNVTDINDRDNDILKRAKEQNIPWQELADFWTKKFLHDMKRLNWTMPNNYLKASEHIPTMTRLIQKILDSGSGYTGEKGIYLDISKVKDFGKLSRFSQEKMLEVAKQFDEDLQNQEKRHPLDITLWRFAEQNQPKHIPSFDPDLIGVESPFGPGRPGWHIECSAMAICSLNEQIDPFDKLRVNGEDIRLSSVEAHSRTIDIHGGGIDLIYPHHESEIAQSETATGKQPFAKYWIHTGTVMYKGEKMSKSLGNLVLVSDLLKQYSANALRWMLLSHTYREPWEFVENELQQAEKTVTVLKKIVPTYNISGGDSEDNEYKALFYEALDNDMDIPTALKLIKTWAQEVPQQQGNEATILKDTIADCLKILGFSFT